MNDPYVNLLFDYVEKIYNKEIDKHYIITTSPKQYNKFEYLEAIALQSYDDLEKTIDTLIEYKDEAKISQKDPLEDSKISAINPLKNNISICILFASPIDRTSALDVDVIAEIFNEYDVEVYIDYLNTDTLSKIYEFDYVILKSQIVKNLILIEDEYLKTKLIRFEDIIDYTSEINKGIFLFYEGKIQNEVNLTGVPLVIIELNVSTFKDNITSFFYKTFKKADISLFLRTYKVTDKQNLKLTPIKKGKISRNQIKFGLSTHIDRKNLQKFVGRKTDLENIIRKIVENRHKPNLITIKGAGGIGKTTTVSKAALELWLRGVYENGVYFISCDSINTFEAFEYEISACFQLSSSSDLKRQIYDNFTYVNTLIIIDNFESVLYSEEKIKIMELVTFLCDYASIIITTRQLLDLEYEDVYELRNFTTDEGVELFNSIYPIINGNDESVGRRDLVERVLNNNPLAIKIIAKGLPLHKDIDVLTSELEQDIFRNDPIKEIFERPEDINIEKSTSLYFSINYSYQKLSEKEKLAFELLSLFPDGIHMENFKKFSKSSGHDIFIEDKDIKLLNDKSLLENSNGLLKLQSIIGRFAEYQFNNKQESLKVKYYNSAFEYNNFSIAILTNPKFFRQNSVIRLLDSYVNNYLKCLEYLVFVDKRESLKASFIDLIEPIFRDTNQTTKFLKHLKVLKEKYKNNADFVNFINFTRTYLIYWTKEFKDSSQILESKYSLSYLYQLDIKNNEFHKLLYTPIANFHSHSGKSSKVIKFLIDKGSYENLIVSDLFELGFMNLANLMAKHDEDTFFSFEIKIALGTVDIQKLDDYIKKIYHKDTLEIVQAYYLKSKVVHVTNAEIKKLAVTNPYTQGLIYLMLAKNFTAASIKKEYYEKSITELSTIKYYYVEAIVEYCGFLLSLNDDSFNYWYALANKEATFYGYRFLLHKLDVIATQKTEKYDESEYAPALPLEEATLYYENFLRVTKE